MEHLRKLLIKAIEMIDSGECEHITPEELEMLSNIVNKPTTMGREDATKYLGVSLNRLHELREVGLLKSPRKVRGFKEKAYYLSDLNKCLEELILRDK